MTPARFSCRCWFERSVRSASESSPQGELKRSSRMSQRSSCVKDAAAADDAYFLLGSRGLQTMLPVLLLLQREDYERA